MGMLLMTCLIILGIPFGVILTLSIVLPIVSPIPNTNATNPTDGSSHPANTYNNSTKTNATNLHNA